MFLGFPGGSLVKNPLAVQETWARSLGREDPLENEMATHSSTLAWKIPWMEEPGRLPSTGVTKSQTRLSDDKTCFLCGASVVHEFVKLACGE